MNSRHNQIHDVHAPGSETDYARAWDAEADGMWSSTTVRLGQILWVYP